MLRNDKKGQGLSLNTIIIAIIVLVVLVVIIMVFTGAFGTTIVPGINECEKKPNQKCASSVGELCGEGSVEKYKVIGIGKCDNDGKCCLNIGNV
ncbi:hypothetical protein HYU15_00775 [Candidatus Woesearchaeota archaeon]|nr:hypothetical protein [Candidatus Woesearchaeota archaeon]